MTEDALSPPGTDRTHQDLFVSLDPPGAGVLSATGDTDVQIATAASDAEFVARVASEEEPSFVIHVIGDPTHAKEEMGFLWQGAVKFLCLPMLLVTTSRKKAEMLARSSDLLVAEFVSEQGQEVSALVPLLRGLDLMCAVETLSTAGADVPYVFGGTRRGIGGYPTLIESRDGLVFSSTTKGRFDTRPARMPVINLSLEPPQWPEGQWPWAVLDPVNMATKWLAGRQLCVFASGNQDRRRPGRERTSAWAEAPWVLAVGATSDPEGAELADYSNTGFAELPGSGPDVVAWGASLINTAKEGTSYAAPKVSHTVAVCAAAIEQVRHQAQLVADGAVEGIPLIGQGVIDTDYRGIQCQTGRTPVPALPEIGVDIEGLRRALAACAEVGIRLDLTPTPERLRRMIIAAARPMRFKPHEVGAGFISEEVVIEWLAGWNARHVAWFLADGAPSSATFTGLSDAPIFVGRDLRTLARAVAATAPVWRWDYGTSEFGIRREQAPT